jgi:phosphatidylinositol alpha-mannosyltransferase
MKIIHIIYDSIGNPWLGGGGATRTHEIYKRLTNKHNVIVLCGNYPNAPEIIDGITYKHLGFGRSYSISRWSFIIFIWMRLPFMRADVFVEDIGAPSPLLITTLKKKSMASVQFLPTKAYIAKRKLIGRFTYKAYSFGLRFYPNIITVSAYAAKQLKFFAPKSNYAVIPNGVETFKFSTDNDNYFAYLGRIDITQKGIDVLLYAVKMISQKDPNIKIKIAGTGEKRELAILNKMIRELGISKQVQYVGEIKNKTKEKFLARCQCLILPSLNETFGISILEAFAFGKPVIASNVGGITELVKSSKAGLLIKVGDVQELALAIEKIYCNKKIAEKYGKAGYDFTKGYRWEKIAENYEMQMINNVEILA